MRIGIFGGSFDPIHYGHLILAEQCRDQAKLDQIWFMPCARQPLKEQGAWGTDRQRAEMIELGIAGCDPFHLSKLELERGGVSYTVDTLDQIRSMYSIAELFLLIGDDSLEAFSKWKSPEKICELATLLIVARPGNGDVDLSVLKPFATDDQLEKIASYRIESPQIEISSTDIRNRIRFGKSIRYLVPRPVERYIQSQGMYKN